MKIDLSQFSSKAELFKHLKENKSAYIAQKKSAVKEADAVSFCRTHTKEDKSEIANKTETASKVDLMNVDAIRVKAVINTTNILDSHYDVHIPKLWNKTLRDTKDFYHVKEHRFNFDNILSDEVKAYVKTMTWKDLGFDWDGETQALIFDSVIHKSTNPLMFEKYVKGKVKNHSVGMQYVRLQLALNTPEPEFKEEKEVWDKYINEIVNKEDAEELGFFWAVTEAKVIEGSAVLRGSNFATPTQSVSEAKAEPSADTQTEPLSALPRKSMFEIIGSSIN